MDLDYAPRMDGEPYDPLPAGGSVDRLRLYENGTTLVLDVGPAVRVATARYRFTFTPPPNGTYLARVTWTMATGGRVFDDSDESVTFPLPTGDPAGLVVSTETVARDAGIPLPLTSDQQAALAGVILGIQAEVQAYLNRSITPSIYTETDCWSSPNGWQLSHEPVIEILAAVADGTGTFTVTYRAGWDAATDPRLAPIRAYVRYHAARTPEAQREGQGRGISSISVEGQSITYDPRPKAGEPGGPPSLASLAAFKRRSIYTRDPQPPGWWADVVALELDRTWTWSWS